VTDPEARAYQCTRKKRHMTADAAIGAARDMQRLAHKSVRFSAFRCKWCEGWHVGRQRKDHLRPVQP
jgi:hypothetical protein